MDSLYLLKSWIFRMPKLQLHVRSETYYLIVFNSSILTK